MFLNISVYPASLMTNGNKEKVNLYLLMPVFSVQIKLKVGGQIEIIFDIT